MNQQQITQMLAKHGPTTSLIKTLVDEHRPINAHTSKLYSEYIGKVPIKKRTVTDPLKVNHKLANDYRADIIDSVVGYMFGNPVVYTIEGKDYSEANLDRVNQEMDSFQIRNCLDDLDAQTGKYASICGYTGRLLYISGAGKESAMVIPPWECKFIYSGSLLEPEYAMRYYEMEHDNDKVYMRVEWYDRAFVTYYQENEAGHYEQTDQRRHGFKGIPLIEFRNNEERQGDFEKVRELIDAYDLLMSDAQNEIEEFRNAYMVFVGAEITTAFLEQARQSGAIQLPEGSNAEFLTKSINDAFIQHQKETLNENIYKFAKTVDMSSEGFASTSGEARKWRLLGMEHKAIMKERKFSQALRQMFTVLCTAWQTKGVNIDPESIYWTFTRSIPVDLLHDAEAAVKLRGMVSERTRLTQLATVDDVEAELEQMAEDREEGRIGSGDA